MKRILYLFLPFLMTTPSFAQVQFSIATDPSVMHNFSPHQKFWAFGQTIIGNFHFTKTESAYLWLAYYTPGRFANNYTAYAKDPAANPAQINYQISGRWQPRQVSVGWKHYFKASFDEENTWGLYSMVGFGLMVTPITNTLNTPIDTIRYSLGPSPTIGSITVRRLTFDLTLGAEYPIGFDVYLYGDVRTWISSSDNISPYLINSSKVPMPLIFSAGIRILIDRGF